ncbi:MAG TPA: DUF6049 family protein [Candidatus Limnocylindria bacterium]|nr:DUF6049 family protein [Candidatus Limnocylindria bacterium]
MSDGPERLTSRLWRTGPIIGLLALGALLVPGPASGLPRATADAKDVRITVTGITPTLVSPDSTVVLSARVVNASDATLVDVGARVRVDSAPLASRGELTAFLEAPEGIEVGLVADASVVEVAPELPPGATADVRIEVTASDLGLVGGFGVHALTLELRVAEPDGARRTAGEARSFLVTGTEGATPTLRIGWLWPLIGTPGRDPDGVLPAAAAASLAESLGPAGRLGAVLEAGAGRPVTWVVDGALLEDVRSLATGNGLAPEVQPDPVAREWLSALAAEQQQSGTDLTALPYADPDLVAVREAGPASDLRRARRLGRSATAEVLGREAPAAPAWPGAGVSDRPTLKTLQAQRVRQVVLDSASLTPQTDLPATPDALAPLSDFPDLQAVTSDRPLADLVAAGPGMLGGLVLAQQRLLAETAMIAAERPGDARSVFAAPPRRWAVSPEWAQAVAGLNGPWLDPVTLDVLTADPGDAPARATLPYAPEARDAQISPAQLAAVSTDRERLTRFAPAVVEPEPFLAAYEPALLGAQSTAWRGEGAAAGLAFTRTLNEAVTADVTSVALLQRGQVTLSSRTGIIPLAVQNGLDRDVRVRVSVVATPSVRLRSEPTDVLTVPAGRTASVDVPAEATVDGAFTVVATLTTAEGATLGQPVDFVVRATGYGTVARIVVGGALILLAVLVLLRVARRIRAVRSTVGGTLKG